MDSFTQSHPSFFAYAVLGGSFVGENTIDSTSTLRMFTSKDEAYAYGEALLNGTDDFACVDEEKYDYARVHTMYNDGRMSCNSTYVRNPWK